MSVYKCRQFQRPETEKECTAHDEDYLPDEYANKYINMQSGDITFVEVLSDPIRLWRVECLIDNQGYLAIPVSEQDALEELKDDLEEVK